MSTSARSAIPHGAAFDAPAETAFVPGESPAPPAVRRARARSSPDGTSRARHLGRVLWAGIKFGSGLLIVVCAAVAVAWGAYRYATTTPRFSVQRFDLDGARRVGVDDIQRLTGIRPGSNLFAIDVEAAERKLLTSPWVKAAKVTRDLPSALRVELTENQPEAVGSIDGKLYLVTEFGEPFKQIEPGDPYDLPIVTGISAENLANNRPAELERVASALEVLRQYQAMPLAKVYPPEELHLGDGRDLSLIVGASGVVLELGSGSWQKKLAMAARVISLVQGKTRTPGVVFLDNQAHPERVVVRMR